MECAYCRAKGPQLSRCVGCNEVRFCNAEHQKQGWPKHITICKLVGTMKKARLGLVILKSSFPRTSRHIVKSLSRIYGLCGITAQIFPCSTPLESTNISSTPAPSKPVTIADASNDMAAAGSNTLPPAPSTRPNHSTTSEPPDASSIPFSDSSRLPAGRVPAQLRRSSRLISRVTSSPPPLAPRTSSPTSLFPRQTFSTSTGLRTSSSTTLPMTSTSSSSSSLPSTLSSSSSITPSSSATTSSSSSSSSSLASPVSTSHSLLPSEFPRYPLLHSTGDTVTCTILMWNCSGAPVNPNNPMGVPFVQPRWGIHEQVHIGKFDPYTSLLNEHGAFTKTFVLGAGTAIKGIDILARLALPSESFIALIDSRWMYGNNTYGDALSPQQTFLVYFTLDSITPALSLGPRPRPSTATHEAGAQLRNRDASSGSSNNDNDHKSGTTINDLCDRNTHIRTHVIYDDTNRRRRDDNYNNAISNHGEEKLDGIGQKRRRQEQAMSEPPAKKPRGCVDVSCEILRDEQFDSSNRNTANNNMKYNMSTITTRNATAVDESEHSERDSVLYSYPLYDIDTLPSQFGGQAAFPFSILASSFGTTANPSLPPPPSTHHRLRLDPSRYLRPGSGLTEEPHFGQPPSMRPLPPSLSWFIGIKPRLSNKGLFTLIRALTFHLYGRLSVVTQPQLYGLPHFLHLPTPPCLSELFDQSTQGSPSPTCSPIQPQRNSQTGVEWTAEVEEVNQGTLIHDCGIGNCSCSLDDGTENSEAKAMELFGEVVSLRKRVAQIMITVLTPINPVSLRQVKHALEKHIDNGDKPPGMSSGQYEDQCGDGRVSGLNDDGAVCHKHKQAVAQLFQDLTSSDWSNLQASSAITLSIPTSPYNQIQQTIATVAQERPRNLLPVQVSSSQPSQLLVSNTSCPGDTVCGANQEDADCIEGSSTSSLLSSIIEEEEPRRRLLLGLLGTYARRSLCRILCLLWQRCHFVLWLHVVFTYLPIILSDSSHSFTPSSATLIHLPSTGLSSLLSSLNSPPHPRPSPSTSSSSNPRLYTHDEVAIFLDGILNQMISASCGTISGDKINAPPPLVNEVQASSGSYTLWSGQLRRAWDSHTHHPLVSLLDNDQQLLSPSSSERAISLPPSSLSSLETEDTSPTATQQPMLPLGSSQTSSLRKGGHPIKNDMSEWLQWATASPFYRPLDPFDASHVVRAASRLQTASSLPLSPYSSASLSTSASSLTSAEDFVPGRVSSGSYSHSTGGCAVPPPLIRHPETLLYPFFTLLNSPFPFISEDKAEVAMPSDQDIKDIVSSYHFSHLQPHNITSPSLPEWSHVLRHASTQLLVAILRDILTSVCLPIASSHPLDPSRQPVPTTSKSEDNDHHPNSTSITFESEDGYGDLLTASASTSSHQRVGIRDSRPLLEEVLVLPSMRRWLTSQANSPINTNVLSLPLSNHERTAFACIDRIEQIAEWCDVSLSSLDRPIAEYLHTMATPNVAVDNRSLLLQALLTIHRARVIGEATHSCSIRVTRPIDPYTLPFENPLHARTFDMDPNLSLSRTRSIVDELQRVSGSDFAGIQFIAPPSRLVKELRSFSIRPSAPLLVTSNLACHDNACAPYPHEHRALYMPLLSGHEKPEVYSLVLNDATAVRRYFSSLAKATSTDESDVVDPQYFVASHLVVDGGQLIDSLFSKGCIPLWAKLSQTGILRRGVSRVEINDNGNHVEADDEDNTNTAGKYVAPGPTSLRVCVDPLSSMWGDGSSYLTGSNDAIMKE